MSKVSKYWSMIVDCNEDARDTLKTFLTIDAYNPISCEKVERRVDVEYAYARLTENNFSIRCLDTYSKSLQSIVIRQTNEIATHLLIAMNFTPDVRSFSNLMSLEMDVRHIDMIKFFAKFDMPVLNRLRISQCILKQEHPKIANGFERFFNKMPNLKHLSMNGDSLFNHLIANNGVREEISINIPFRLESLALRTFQRGFLMLHSSTLTKLHIHSIRFDEICLISKSTPNLKKLTTSYICDHTRGSMNADNKITEFGVENYDKLDVLQKVLISLPSLETLYFYGITNMEIYKILGKFLLNFLNFHSFLKFFFLVLKNLKLKTVICQSEQDPDSDLMGLVLYKLQRTQIKDEMNEDIEVIVDEQLSSESNFDI